MLDGRGQVGAERGAGGKDLAAGQDECAVSVAMLVAGLGGLPGRLSLRCVPLDPRQGIGGGRLASRVIDDLAVFRTG